LEDSTKTNLAFESKVFDEKQCREVDAQTPNLIFYKPF